MEIAGHYTVFPESCFSAALTPASPPEKRRTGPARERVFLLSEFCELKRHTGCVHNWARCWSSLINGGYLLHCAMRFLSYMIHVRYRVRNPPLCPTQTISTAPGRNPHQVGNNIRKWGFLKISWVPFLEAVHLFNSYSNPQEVLVQDFFFWALKNKDRVYFLKNKPWRNKFFSEI